MEMLGSALAIGGPIFGSIMSAGNTVDQGYAVEKAKNWESVQMIINAKNIEGKGSYDIEESVNKYEVLISRAIALNGHQGGGGSDPTFMRIIADLAVAGERDTQRITFGYKSKANLLKKQAAATRFEGREFRKGTKNKALATLLSGAGKSATNFLSGSGYQGTRLSEIFS